MFYNRAMSKVLFGKAVVTSKAEGVLKSALDVENYTTDDFMKYWKTKAKEKDIIYVPVKYSDRAIIKSLMKNFKSSEIKIMMDYLWDSDERIYTKDGVLNYTSYGLFLLSNKWLNGIYNKAIRWYNNYKEAPVRGREAVKEGVTIEF